jgi:hypothetical protein
MNKLLKNALVAASILLLGTGAAQAQTTQFGVQGTISFPQSDLGTLVNNNAGAGVGINARVDLGKGNSIVPRLDYTRYSNTTDGVDVTADVTYVGVDYNYYFSQKCGVGPYVGLGAGFASVHIDASDAWDSLSVNGSAPYYDFNAGYAFTRHSSVEVRLIKATISNFTGNFDGYSAYSTENFSGQTLDVSYIYRF